jgi:peptidoglycan/xylan/chitin deacetylase (PgdA/CDA1 family)
MVVIVMLNQLRSLKWRIVRLAISSLPLTLIQSLCNCHVVGFYYHLVSRGLDAHLSQLYTSVHSVKSFGRELDCITKFFTPISASQLIVHLRAGKPLPNNSCLITFDDGYREVYQLAFPELARRRIPFVFFLTSQFVGNHVLFVENTISLILNICKELPALEINVLRVLADNGELVDGTMEQCLRRVSYKRRFLIDAAAQACGFDSREYAVKNRPYVTVEEVREMVASGLVEVGAHGVDHARNEELDSEEQIRQVSESISYISQQFDPPHKLYAFPYSDRAVDSDTYEKIFRQVGVDLAFGTGELRIAADPRIVHRCWMDSNVITDPQSKIASIFRSELLRRWQKTKVSDGRS